MEGVAPAIPMDHLPSYIYRLRVALAMPVSEVEGLETTILGLDPEFDAKKVYETIQDRYTEFLADDQPFLKPGSTKVAGPDDNTPFTREEATRNDSAEMLVGQEIHIAGGPHLLIMSAYTGDNDIIYFDAVDETNGQVYSGHGFRHPLLTRMFIVAHLLPKEPPTNSGHEEDEDQAMVARPAQLKPGATQNIGGREFIAINSESTRFYDYKDGHRTQIDAPVWLSTGGTGHRIITANGMGHWVPLRGLEQISWIPKEGEPAFVR